MAKIELKCEQCNSLFLREKKEYNRAVKVGRRNFCSRKCVGIATKNNLGNFLGNGNTEKLIPGNRQDEYSPFRYFVKKARERKHAYDIDVEYLKDLWEKQDGKCIFTGIKMKLHKNGTEWSKDKGNPWKSSLDRIDSSKGYLKGNVRFICNIGNMCKQSWDDETVLKFCQEVVKTHD